MPRCEAACLTWGQKDFIKHRHKVCLFGTVSQNVRSESSRTAHQVVGAASQPDVIDESESEDELIVPRHSLLKHYTVYYIQSPEFVHKNRYAQRWLLITQNELHASSVQQPHYAGWRWLLHSCRVPLLKHFDGVSQPAASQSVGVSSSASSGDPQPIGNLSPCAGIGDPAGLVWMCFPCLKNICTKKIKDVIGRFG